MKKYSQQQIEEMIALHSHGYTAAEVAATLGRDRNTVARALKEAGVKLQSGEGWRKRKLDPAQEIELVRLYEAEVPVAELQERFGVGRTYIYSMLKKYQCITALERAKELEHNAPIEVKSRPRKSPNPALKNSYAARDRNRQYVYNYYLTHSCVDCGESDPIVLDLDHVRGKKIANVSQLVHGCAALKRIDAEIAKCDVVCANCHRRRTADSQGWHSGLAA